MKDIQNNIVLKILMLIKIDIYLKKEVIKMQPIHIIIMYLFDSNLRNFGNMFILIMLLSK